LETLPPWNFQGVAAYRLAQKVSNTTTFGLCRTSQSGPAKSGEKLKMRKSKNPQIAVAGLSAPIKGSTFTPRPETPAETLWKELGGKKEDDAKNNCVAEFLLVAGLVLNNYETFSLQDFLVNSRALCLPPDDVRKVYEKWVNRMTASGRIAEIPTSYDEPRFRVL
jgi:hypothetical protein